MPSPAPNTATTDVASVHGGYLPPWTVGQLPDAPSPGLRSWLAMAGPGVLLAGSSIGSGEWLFGPAVTAQYGAMLLWLAGLSIVAQVFCNLEMIRYAVYCGESIIVGYLRTWPGPRFWLVWYAVLDVAAIWPFNASNAAVPLAAAILGHLPGGGTVELLGATIRETQLVKLLGYAIFVTAFVPLIFGGTIYRMLARVMTVKLVLVLGYLMLFTLLTVSAHNAWQVLSGFVRIGSVPLRAQTIIVGPHFTLSRSDGATTLTVKGTVERGAPLVTSYVVDFGASSNEPPRKFDSLSAVDPTLRGAFELFTGQAAAMAHRGRFTVEDQIGDTSVVVVGSLSEARQWLPEQVTLTTAGRPPRRYERLDEVPEPLRGAIDELVANQGLHEVNLLGYLARHGRLPPLDWAMLAALAAIAGSGGMSNTLFSNFARDAGWGMGARVGTIPSAVGGLKIQLSHVGEVFPMDETNLARWRLWMRHARRNQVGIWMACSVVGMALPCMLSLQFIRHAPVAGDRVAAMVAAGMAAEYPQHEHLLWIATLICGFLVLAPGQILSGDMISRRWTDIIWTSNSRAQRMSGDRVRWIYYSILTLYGLWGLVALSLFNPLEIAKIAGVLMNVALGWTSLHAVYVNRSLLPRELQSHVLAQAGAVACGIFFLTVSVIVVCTL